MAKVVLILAFFGCVIATPGKPSLDIFRDVNGTDVLVMSTVPVRIGDDLTLSCVIVNVENDSNNQVVWSRKSNDSSFQNESGKSEPSKLHFSRIALKNEGIYFCASTKYNIQKTVYIQVVPTKPEIHAITNSRRRRAQFGNGNQFGREPVLPIDIPDSIRDILNGQKITIPDNTDHQYGGGSISGFPRSHDDSVFPERSYPPESDLEAIIGRPPIINIPSISDILKGHKITTSNNADHIYGDGSIGGPSHSHDSAYVPPNLNDFEKKYHDLLYPHGRDSDITGRRVIPDMNIPDSVRDFINSPKEPIFHNTDHKYGGGPSRSHDDDSFYVPSYVGRNNIEEKYPERSYPPERDFEIIDIPEKDKDSKKPKSTYGMLYFLAAMGGLTLLSVLMYFAARSNPNWGRGNQPRAACDHRMCNRNRRNNQSAGCLRVLTTTGDEVPPLIVPGSNRVEGVTVLSSLVAPADATDSREMNQLDVPPSYDSSSVHEGNNVEPSAPQSDLPPSYDEALQTMMPSAPPSNSPTAPPCIGFRAPLSNQNDL